MIPDMIFLFPVHYTGFVRDITGCFCFYTTTRLMSDIHVPRLGYFILFNLCLSRHFMVRNNFVVISLVFQEGISMQILGVFFG